MGTGDEKQCTLGRELYIKGCLLVDDGAPCAFRLLTTLKRLTDESACLGREPISRNHLEIESKQSAFMNYSTFHKKCMKHIRI